MEKDSEQIKGWKNPYVLYIVLTLGLFALLLRLLRKRAVARNCCGGRRSTRCFPGPNATRRTIGG
jgi:hypothetical protein